MYKLILRTGSSCVLSCQIWKQFSAPKVKTWNFTKNISSRKKSSFYWSWQIYIWYEILAYKEKRLLVSAYYYNTAFVFINTLKSFLFRSLDWIFRLSCNIRIQDLTVHWYVVRKVNVFTRIDNARNSDHFICPILKLNKSMKDICQRMC